MQLPGGGFRRRLLRRRDAGAHGYRAYRWGTTDKKEFRATPKDLFSKWISQVSNELQRRGKIPFCPPDDEAYEWLVNNILDE